MPLSPVKRSDPFEFPPRIVPLGMTYQWVAKTVMGDVQKNYTTLVDRGWIAVPAQWHPKVFDVVSGPIEIGGQILMCHAAARDEEADRIAGAQTILDDWAAKYGGTFSGGVRVSYDELSETRLVGDPKMAQTIIDDWAAKYGGTFSGGVRVSYDELSETRLVGDPKMAQTIIERSPMTQPNRVAVRLLERKPRHALLRWLFNLISKEIES